MEEDKWDSEVIQKEEVKERKRERERERERHDVGSGGNVEYEGEASRSGVIE